MDVITAQTIIIQIKKTPIPQVATGVETHVNAKVISSLTVTSMVLTLLHSKMIFLEKTAP